MRDDGIDPGTTYHGIGWEHEPARRMADEWDRLLCERYYVGDRPTMAERVGAIIGYCALAWVVARIVVGLLPW